MRRRKIGKKGDATLIRIRASATIAIATVLVASAGLYLILHDKQRQRQPRHLGGGGVRRQGQSRGSALLPLSSRYRYYYPNLLAADTAQDIEVLKREWLDHTPGENEVDGDEDNDRPYPLIHVVHTRFMQEQWNLTSLGLARLGLFRVFCLPTMAKQTTQQFVWLIKTDPNLVGTGIFDELLRLLEPYPNIYLVASNRNFRINRFFPGGWRGGAEPTDMASCRVYTGNRRRLELAMTLQSEFAVLETRLDADDGLHVQYLRTLQQMAIRAFGIRDGTTVATATPKWMYWCIPRTMEWHWLDDTSNSTVATGGLSAAASAAQYGALVGTEQETLCITPGITVGFAFGTNESDVPIFAHDKIVITLQESGSNNTNHNCGFENAIDCLQFVQSLLFGAIRSRTPTSAGMWNVLLDPSILQRQSDTDSLLYYAMWDHLHHGFALNRNSIKSMNRYLSDHLLEIVRDNLLGQCTTGHSCKVRADTRSLRTLLTGDNIPEIASLPDSTHTYIQTATYFFTFFQEKARRSLEHLIAARGSVNATALDSSSTH